MFSISPKDICFHALGCDRANEKRENPQELHAMLSDPETRFVSFQKGKPLISLQDDTPCIALLRSQELSTVEEPLFLGMRAGPLFLIDQPPHSLSTSQKYIDTRRIAGSLSAEDASLLGYAQSLLYWNQKTLFCSACGNRIIGSIAADRKHCTACNTDVFPRINPVVIVLLTHKERVLLARQPTFPKGMYSCIAGFVELGESLQCAVRREVKEEVGLELSHVELIGDQPWPYPAQMMLGFHAEATSPEIRIDRNELEDARWFSREELQVMTSGKNDSGFFIPPSIAIARSLVGAFL
ncbi:MAG: NAD(+) diphosphatase [Myxococcota bacterium]|nr:NAD(+) diphosphatase [Myxococcota bacterium]